MSEPVTDLNGAEPAYAPYLRFARNVLLVDLLMGAAVFVVSVWQGWTSVEESTTAIFGGGAILLGLAILPAVGPWLSIIFYSPLSNSPMNDYARFHAIAGRDDLKAMRPRATMTLFAAGFIPVACAAVVAAVIL